MIEFLYIIKETPFYVWVILVYLLLIGIRSLKKRIIYLPKFFTIPLILSLTQYKAFLSPNYIIFILVIMFSTIASFFIHINSKIRVIKNSKSIEVPGGYSTLLILISFFAVKYYFGYLESTEPNFALTYALTKNIISGLFTGYFIGRTVGYTYKYLNV